MALRVILIVGLSGFVALSVVAYFTWAIWISRYVVRYGMKPAFFLWAWAPLVDYSRARRIARKCGNQKPWFLKFFVSVFCAALGFMLASGVAGLIILFTQQR